MIISFGCFDCFDLIKSLRIQYHRQAEYRFSIGRLRRNGVKFEINDTFLTMKKLKTERLYVPTIFQINFLNIVARCQPNIGQRCSTEFSVEMRCLYKKYDRVTLEDIVRNDEIRMICRVEDVVRWGRQRRRNWYAHTFILNEWTEIAQSKRCWQTYQKEVDSKEDPQSDCKIAGNPLPWRIKTPDLEKGNTALDLRKKKMSTSGISACEP